LIVNTQIRTRIAELTATLARLGDLLSAKGAGDLPAFQVARVAVLVDIVASRIGRLVDQLEAGAATP
jgi:hypothetical protein